MRAVKSPGRWVWAVSGLATAAVIVLPAGKGMARLLGDGGAPWEHTVTRTVSVPQPVTRLNVDNDGPISVTAGPVRQVQISEIIGYDGRLPTVPESVSGGELTVSGPPCRAPGTCGVSLRLTVPAGVTAYLNSQGGPVHASGLAAATIRSGGGPVRVGSIEGTLSADTEGGPLVMAGLSGRLTANTGGGTAVARELTSAAVNVTTEGGEALLHFAAAPGSVVVSTGGGAARLWLPGGPYALTADTGGGPEDVGVATDPASPRPVTVTSEGGQVWIVPPGAGPGPRDAPAPPAPPVPPPAG